VLLLVVVIACVDDEKPRSAAVGPSATEQPHSTKLVAPAPGLAEQCTLAADLLGFAVPCPTALPAVDGVGAECREKEPWAPELPRCVSQAGGDETLDTIFSLSVDDYDGLGAVRHLVVEARRLERAPSTPCFGSEQQPELRAGSRTLVVLACGERTAEAATQVRHGEGAHYAHLLGYWDEAGIRYVVSIHGHSAANRELIGAMAESIQLVRP
jgi:hypothetical protein